MHTGQRVISGEQFLQIAKCPHGMQTTVAVLVQHLLHCRCLFNIRSSCSGVCAGSARCDV